MSVFFGILHGKNMDSAMIASCTQKRWIGVEIQADSNAEDRYLKSKIF